MTAHPVTVDLPEAVFTALREIAKARAQSVEEVVIDQLRSVLSIPMPALSPDEESELVAFKFLSDDTLQNIAREQTPRRVQERMQTLMDRNNLGTIAQEEYGELSELVERSQRLMLRKAWAAGVLMERGYTITGQDIAPEDA